MENITNAQAKKLNYVSDVRDPAINLGSRLQEVISLLPVRGTPVNAVAATVTLTLTGVVKHKETFTIDNPALAGTDVYEFLADAAQVKTAPANIAVSIVASTVKASVTLTLAVQPTSGDTMTIGSRVYTFVPVGTANGNGEVSVGADLAAAKLAVVAAINGTDGWNIAHTLVSAATFTADTCVITAFAGGTAGNSIASTEVFTSGSNVFSTATLASGADCTAANADGIIISAVTASDTQGVGAAQGAGTTVDFTADVAGAAGNVVTCVETLANGAFGTATFLGGVNGTVGFVNKPLVDDTYLYIAINDNLVSGKNWRRISLGSQY